MENPGREISVCIAKGLCKAGKNFLQQATIIVDERTRNSVQFEKVIQGGCAFG